jgi:predicted NBD/HSP70 family sugar kinase
MIKDISEIMSKIKDRQMLLLIFQILILVSGLLLILSSSCEIVDITKLQVKSLPNPSYPTLAIGGILLVLSIFLFRNEINKVDDNGNTGYNDNEKKSADVVECKYYIGIDLGRYKLDCCILKILTDKKGEVVKSEVVDGSYSKIMNFVTRDTEDIIQSISRALESAFNLDCIKEVSIEGIGFGLPGQINPNRGYVNHSPGFESLCGLNFYEWPFRFKAPYVKEGDCIRIAIDNDVRCATRFLWKEKGLTDAICIFDGSGLGSGVILDSKLYYGSSFTAGEIGHTTISGCFRKGEKGRPPCFSELFLDEQKKCKCERGDTSYHLETLLSSDGIVKIAENLNKDKFAQLLEDMKDDVYTKKYKEMLTKKEFADYDASIRKYIEENKSGKTISTHLLSLAYYSGNDYAKEVVALFNEYLAIGIANYINILNPKSVYLGGGIIRGFYKKQLQAVTENQYTHKFLKKKIQKYCLAASGQFDIELVDYTYPIAPAGAAMIFIDETYCKKLTSTNGEYHKLIYKDGKFCKGKK